MSEPELSEQSVATYDCPYCGAEATEESQARHKLSALDYLHDDVVLTCASCEETWTYGVPIGDPDEALSERKRCDSCEEYMLVHRIDVDPNPSKVEPDEDILLHLKCPECYLYREDGRTVNDSNVVLVGDPRITGSFDGSDVWASRE